jgi:hypothetical protein
VTGTGGNGLNPTVVALAASSGPSGENPTGPVDVHFGGGVGSDWEGDASCLSVRGNTAIIGFGEGRHQDAGGASWVTGLVRIVDNGPGDDTFEFVELERGPTGPPFMTPPGDPLPGPTDCSSFPPDQEVYDIASGGFQVVDGQPPRASND